MVSLPFAVFQLAGAWTTDRGEDTSYRFCLPTAVGSGCGDTRCLGFGFVLSRWHAGGRHCGWSLATVRHCEVGGVFRRCLGGLSSLLVALPYGRSSWMIFV